MKKVYFNLLHSKGVVIDADTRTYTLITTDYLKQNSFCFYYPVKMARIIELKRHLQKQGFARV